MRSWKEKVKSVFGKVMLGFGIILLSAGSAGDGGTGPNDGGDAAGDAAIKKKKEDDQEGAVQDPTTRQTEFDGKTVTQDDSLFDPNFKDLQGRTNIERMKDGLAPIGNDGKSVNIHHLDQTNHGSVIEIFQTEHTENYGKLHTNTGQSPSQIDRTEFTKWRRAYWKNRANDFK